MRQVKYINMLLSKDIKNIVGLFLVWRIFLIFLLYLAFWLVPLGNKDRFLGGGLINYLRLPQVFAWANFDGEHYLSIAIFGYKGLEQAFFPIYPKLIELISKPFHYDLQTALLSSAIAGLVISNLFFLGSLIVLWKLIRIDFSEKIATGTLIVIMMFPTSLFFGAVYNESLFLFLSVASFYFARKKNLLMASIFGAVASATRIFGIFLLPALLIEGWVQKCRKASLLWLLLIPSGLLLYMLYLWVSIGDPIAFYHLQRLVGEQRYSGATFIAQTFFRYIKMLLTVDINNPIYQIIVLEFVTGIVFLLLLIYGYFKKIRLSYIFYGVLGYLLSTVQGSLSSAPRYFLILFPCFLALAIFLSNIPKLVRSILLFISLVLLSVETMLFLRGYWVA